MPIKPRTNSRFAISEPILTRGGDGTYGIAKKYRFMDRNNLSDKDIKTVTVSIDQAGKWDELAKGVYGNIDLHWIIPMFNHIDNPFGGLPKNGQVLEHPSPEAVFAEL